MNKILFAGTPELSVPLLKILAKRFCVVGVLTAPDKPQGRSKVPVPSPVKATAMDLNLPVLQYESLKSEARRAVAELGADTLVTFAFGKIFGPKFLALFTEGTFNVHPSALPMFRGSSPIHATILNGLKKLTISLQKIGVQMDEGDIFFQSDFDLLGCETTETLSTVVADKVAELLPDVFDKIFKGELKSQPQIGEPSYCSMLTKEQGKLDFSDTVANVHCKIRAMYPWPKAFATTTDGREIFITGVWGDFNYIYNPDSSNGIQAGQVVGVQRDKGIGIACKDGILWVNALQLPAKKELDFKSFLNGNSWIRETVFK